MSKPVISLIAAMASNRCIGINNTLPWRISADLKHFKALTTGKPVVMGRKTFESLGRPLPNRLNIIISRSAGSDSDDVVYASSLEDAFAKAGAVPEIMVIGGAQIYAQALGQADRLYLTEIDKAVEGDAFFPDFGPEWGVAEADGPHHDEASGLNYTYKTYEKR